MSSTESEIARLSASGFEAPAAGADSSLWVGLAHMDEKTPDVEGFSHPVPKNGRAAGKERRGWSPIIAAPVALAFIHFLAEVAARHVR